MAYLGRGGFSSFGGGLGGGLRPNDNDNNNDNRNNERLYYRWGMFRMHFYIPFDNNYVIFELIAAIIIFAIMGITFLTTYKPTVVDPLENTKKVIMHSYIIIILALVIVTLLANYFSKDKNILIKRLIVIIITTIITILVFFGIKANLNSTYTESKFEQIYIQENGEKTTDIKSKFNVGLNGVQLQTDKEYYVDECVKAYNVFSIRFYVLVGVNALLILLLIYQISKVSKIQEKRDRISRDDAILFDEEENVKF